MSRHEAGFAGRTLIGKSSVWFSAHPVSCGDKESFLNSQCLTLGFVFMTLKGFQTLSYGEIYFTPELSVAPSTVAIFLFLFVKPLG